jgi:hypothetical protein
MPTRLSGFLARQLITAKSVNLSTTWFAVLYDEELQHLLLSKTRIISTAHKSIATLFHNHIGFAKADPAAAPTVCTCTEHTDLPRRFKLKDGTQHIGMKVTDLDKQHPLCSRNIPVPCTDHQLNFLITAFRVYESWCSDASSTTQRAAELLFTHVPVTVMDDTAKRTISACLRRCGQSITRKEISVGSAEQYTKLRKQYDDLIFSPLDKNTGAMFMCSSPVPVPIMRNLVSPVPVPKFLVASISCPCT